MRAMDGEVETGGGDSSEMGTVTEGQVTPNFMDKEERNNNIILTIINVLHMVIKMVMIPL